MSIYGFLIESTENQVQPFTIPTPDGETLYGWHILPLALYAKHEEVLLQEPPGPSSHITQTQAFKLLSTDPESRLLIYCPSPHSPPTQIHSLPHLEFHLTPLPTTSPRQRRHRFPRLAHRHLPHPLNPLPLKNPRPNNRLPWLRPLIRHPKRKRPHHRRRHPGKMGNGNRPHSPRPDHHHGPEPRHSRLDCRRRALRRRIADRICRSRARGRLLRYPHSDANVLLWRRHPDLVASADLSETTALSWRPYPRYLAHGYSIGKFSTSQQRCQLDPHTCDERP